MKGLALAPSQHPRSTRSRSRTSRAAFGTVLLFVAAVALSACGSQQAGAAAIVNGTSISEKDVQTVSTQLNTLAKGDQKLSAGIVLVNLILAPYVLAEADRAGKAVPDAQARKAIAAVPKPSRQTLDFVRMQLAIPSLSTAAKASILAKVTSAKISVNPRYGTFDSKQIAISPNTPNWIKASTPAAPR